MSRIAWAVLALSLVGCGHDEVAAPVGVEPVKAEKVVPPPIVDDVAGNTARCEANDATACYNVGVAYSQGTYNSETVAKDLPRAAAAFARACDAKHAEGCHLSGHAVFDGWAGEPDTRGGLAKLATACDLGSPDACYDVAQTKWDNGDYTAGLAGFEHACELASNKGCYELGFLYARNSVPDKTRALQAVTLLDQACARGYAPSCASVGEIFERGEPMANLEPNPTRAVESYERACQLNAEYGCLELGRVYQLGTDKVPVDLERAGELYTSACDAENAFGCTHLADLVYAKDAAKAQSAEDRACTLTPRVCLAIGESYAKADQRKKDTKKATVFFTRGCDGKDAASCEKLATTTKDSKAAKALYAKACKLQPDNAAVCKKAK